MSWFNRINCRKTFDWACYIVPPGLFMKNCFISVHSVNGSSMSPSLNPESPWYIRWGPNDIVIVVKTLTPMKGDIVVTRDPTSNKRIIKRLVALENEVVQMMYRTAQGFEQCTETRVPKGHCWVEGDNPSNSIDSRNFGPIPLGLVESNVLAVIWPLWRIHILADEGYVDEQNNDSYTSEKNF